jgi:hypothetical protein
LSGARSARIRHYRRAVLRYRSSVKELTDPPKLQNFYRWIALLRRHKALILAKNVLYCKNNTPLEVLLPLPGALFFAADGLNGLG